MGTVFSLDPDSDSLLQDSSYKCLRKKEGTIMYFTRCLHDLSYTKRPPDIQRGALPERENGLEPIGTITTNMKTDSHCILSIIMYVFIDEYSPF